MHCTNNLAFNLLLQEEEDIYEKADSVFKSWIDKHIEYNDFRYDGVDVIHIDENGEVELKELIHKFDTLKYFRILGQKEFPSIATLVRIHFSKMDNGAEQERVFSTAANAQRKKQARMKFDMLEKRTLLAHNKDLIKSGVL